MVKKRNQGSGLHGDVLRWGGGKRARNLPIKWGRGPEHHVKDAIKMGDAQPNLTNLDIIRKRSRNSGFLSGIGGRQSVLFD